MKSNNPDNEINIDLYSALLLEHGDSYKSLNWGSRESQQLRFSVLSEIGIQAGDSVLDVGCGLGDLYQWFKNTGLDVEYEGIDITPDMVDRAREFHPGVRFSTGVIDDVGSSRKRGYDYLLASGIFAHRQHQAFQFMCDTLRQMFRIANKGVAFNCLSGWRPEQEAGEFYADPIDTIEFCRSLSNRIVFRHDYHPGDFTIYLYRSESTV